MEHSKNVVKANEVIGLQVKSSINENLGIIEEIILDKKNGRVRYVVLSFGGFIGIGNKYFAVPWEALVYNFEEDSFHLNLTKERLENAPGFDKNNWPDVADDIWGESIYQYYQSVPYWDKK